MKKYECMYITDIVLPKADLESLVELMTKLITDNEGELISNLDLGQRKLAYQINKKRNGVYGLLTFNGNNKTLDAMNKRLNYEEKLIRYMITKIEH